MENSRKTPVVFGFRHPSHWFRGKWFPQSQTLDNDMRYTSKDGVPPEACIRNGRILATEIL